MTQFLLKILSTNLRFFANVGGSTQPPPKKNLCLTKSIFLDMCVSGGTVLSGGLISPPDNHGSSRLANVMGCIIRNGGYIISPLVPSQTSGTNTFQSDSDWFEWYQTFAISLF